MIAVTGGAGFIGTAVVQELERREEDALVIDRIRGRDILNPVSFSLEGCDAVVHLAGKLGTSELFDDPHGAVEANVTGTLNVLEQCRQFGVRYLGISMPRVWSNIYAATKTCAVELAEAYGLRYGFSVAHVTAYNVYGPGQRVHGVQKLIPTFATRSWRGEPMPVWGTGEQKVDLIHVDDVARVLVNQALGKFPLGMPIAQAGTGHGLTVLEVARLVGQVTGHSVVEFLPLRAGETSDEGVVAPRLGPFSVIADPRFAETVEWYKEDRL